MVNCGEEKGFPKGGEAQTDVCEVRVNLDCVAVRSPCVEHSTEGTGGEMQGETGSQNLRSCG